MLVGLVGKEGKLGGSWWRRKGKVSEGEISKQEGGQEELGSWVVARRVRMVRLDNKEGEASLVWEGTKGTDGKWVEAIRKSRASKQ